MPCYVGLDTAKKFTSVCIVSAKGDLIREGQVETTPKAVIAFLRGDGLRYARVGMEAGSMAPWLCEGLRRARLPVVCVDTWHAHGALKTQRNKTDRTDAYGIAQLMRTGSYRPVHLKSTNSTLTLGLLKSRKLILSKLRDIQSGIRGLLLSFGLKLPPGKVSAFGSKAQRLTRNHGTAAAVVAPLLEVCSAMLKEVCSLDERISQLASNDPVCKLLTTAPGVGPITALLFRSAIDQPERFANSRAVGAHFGLTPRTHQTGETERRGRISKRGDPDVRASLFLAAITLMRSGTRESWLQAWGVQLASRRGAKRAGVAVARRLATILHRMWMTGTPFRWARTA